MSDSWRKRVTPRTTVNAVLGGIVGVLIAVVVASMVVLWPHPGDRLGVPSDAGEIAGGSASAATEFVTGTVTGVYEEPCVASPSPDDVCVTLAVKLPVGERVTVTLDQLRTETVRVSTGDRVKLASFEANVAGVTQTQYSYVDQPRGGKMVVIALLFVAIVIAVGRLRGGLALVGVGAAVVLLGTFLLPSILAGHPPVLVAVVGALGIMIVVLYLAHGISHRTTAALFGSVFGIVFTAFAGFLATRWLGFTGIAGEEDAGLLLAAPGLNMSDVLTATMVIAGLGVLNDITVAQASGVWEMRGLNPSLSKRRIYVAAMRMGRDHIASSIYTLVFAYAGAMFVVLLLLFTTPQDLGQLVTSERISQEVIRTLIGAAGLVLSMPVTTALAVLFAPAAVGSDTEDDAPVQLPSHGHTH